VPGRRGESIFTVAPDICGISVWKVLHASVLSCRIFGVDFCEIYATRLNVVGARGGAVG